MSNEFISSSIGLFMGQRNVRQIDAFLVFNSLGESCTHLKRTVKEISQALGMIGSSIVVLMSKADLSGTRVSRLRQTVTSECKELNLQFMEWTDNADERALATQLTNLRQAISRVTPFTIDRIAELERAIQERALFIREHDSDRYVTQSTTVEVPQLEEHEVDMEYSVTEAVRKYTSEEELMAAAREMQRTGPKDHPKVEQTQSVQKVKKTIPKSGGWNILGISRSWTKMQEVTEDVIVPETKVTYVERPIDYYVQMLRNEVELKPKTLTRKVKEYEQKMTEEERDVQVEQFTMDHYLEIARRELVQNVWTQMQGVANQDQL